MKSEPLVSVLTPVFNGEQYLAECIESVLSQTYQNWEYVIVNNRSTDNSLLIANSYAERDKRIKVVTNKKHLPQMRNLNNTFTHMADDSLYCKVVHADDWLFPECLERMVYLAEEYPGIGIVSSYRLDDTRVGLSGLPYPSHIKPGREMGRTYLLQESYYFGSPSTLLIRSDLIRKREKFYDESSVHSDISACLDILREADFGFVHQVLSYTRRHDKSVTNTLIKKNFTDMLHTIKDLKTYGPDFLTDEELKKRLKQRERIFYIRLARLMFHLRSVKVKSRYEEELIDLGMKLSYTKLTKAIFSEMIRYPIINAIVKRQRK